MTPTSDNISTYNLKAVVQETGLKPDTLRAWERRYGLPSPERSTGKHRLYSQRDIDLLKWLVARQEEGMTISRAADLWHKLIAEGQDPLQTPTGSGAVGPVLMGMPRGGENLVEMRTAWIDACLDFDENQAEMILAQAFALYPVELVCRDFLGQALIAIGDGWHEGRISAQQEHFASALAMRRLDALVTAAPPPTRPQRILVACPPEETHTFSPMLLTLLLRRQGWHTIYLGANVPLLRFEHTIRQTRPHLVILAAQILSTASSLYEMALLLEREHIPLGFGGLIFTRVPGLSERIPGHYLGNTLDGSLAIIEKLVTAPGLAHATTSSALPEGYAEALAHFAEHSPAIGARVWQLLKPNGGAISPTNVTTANAQMALGILSALRLGNLDFLGADLSWIKGLMAERQIPDAALDAYLRAYNQAMAEHLDVRGQPILTWFAARL